MSVPCPVCEATRLETTTAGLALGVALGVAFRDLHRVTALVCGAHRLQWTVAMARTAQEMRDATIEDGEP